jgi:hypothetical protein
MTCRFFLPARRQVKARAWKAISYQLEVAVILQLMGCGPDLIHVTARNGSERVLVLTHPSSPPLPLEKIPVNPHRLDAARIIRLGAVDAATNSIMPGTPTATGNPPATTSPAPWFIFQRFSFPNFSIWV